VPLDMTPRDSARLFYLIFSTSAFIGISLFYARYKLPFTTIVIAASLVALVAISLSFLLPNSSLLGKFVLASPSCSTTHDSFHIRNKLNGWNSLLYLSNAFAQIVRDLGVEGALNSTLPLLFIGMLVRVLGIGWSPFRRVVMNRMPSSIATRTPPAA